MKRYVLNEKELHELKKKEIEILKATLLVIKKMNLTYFCVGGTALGAVKYGGFIPWDDDIDIAMPRPDYEIFKKKSQKFFNKKYFVQSVDSDPNFCLGLIKVRDLSTEFVEMATAKIKIKNGIFIDVFPVDGINGTTFSPSFLYKLRQSKISSKLITLDFKQKRSFKHFASSLISNIIYAFRSPNYLCKLNEKELSSFDFNKSEYVYCRCLSFSKSLLGNYSFGKFEGIEVVLPEKIDEYMFLCFGDISKDPPNKSRIPHHYVTRFKI